MGIAEGIFYNRLKTIHSFGVFLTNSFYAWDCTINKVKIGMSKQTQTTRMSLSDTE